MTSAEYVANNIGISGFKYVLGRNISRLRRLVWLLVILLASAWMIWNIQGRVTYFLSRPSAITTGMKFKDKLMFPKITICNQNMFRSSKVFEETSRPRFSPTVYEAMDRYLQALWDDSEDQSMRDDVISRYGNILSHNNTKEFYKKVTHQRDTFIQRCLWKGRQCGPENFTEVFTNMGLCYQFNVSQEDTVIDKANKNGGLKLTLFVEQFDYMRDPQTRAGVLVVISDHNETEAFAKEQGIGVTVGQSASVSLQRSEVIDLPHPYGSCGTAELEHLPPNTPYTYHKCHLNCLTSFITKTCGCLSLYMPGQDVPTCSLLRTLECVKPNQDVFYKTRQIDACDCPTPCMTGSYSSSLSRVRFSDTYEVNLALTEETTSLPELNRAIAIQAWALFNAANVSITDSMAVVSSTLLEYRKTFIRYYKAMQNIISEVRQSMNLISEQNIVDEVMMAIKPEQEVDVTWEEVNDAIDSIEMHVDLVHSSVLFWIEETFTDDDIDLFLAEDRADEDIFLFEVEFANEYIEESINRFLQNRETFAKLTSAAKAQMQNLNLNSSQIFDSILNEDTYHLMDGMAAMNKEYIDVIYKNFELGDDQVLNIQNTVEQPRYGVKSEFYSNNMLKLEIYFKSLGVQEIRKSPAYSPEGLVCDIGGSIGLCLGGSVLTLFEFFDIVAILCGGWKKRRADCTSKNVADDTDPHY